MTKCEMCGDESKSPRIWHVPHWFCSHKCVREFYDAQEDIVTKNGIITVKKGVR